MTSISDFSPLPSQTRVFDRLGKTIRRSQNLRAILVHATKKPVNVVEIRALNDGYIGVAFHFDGGDAAISTWSDWRVVLDWIAARRSWSVERVTLSAPLFNRAQQTSRVATIRKRGTLVTSYVS
jgi:hypothetical protein